MSPKRELLALQIQVLAWKGTERGASMSGFPFPANRTQSHRQIVLS